MNRRGLALGCVVLVLFGLWQALAMLAGDGVIAAPMGTLRRLLVMLSTPHFWRDARETFSAFGWSLLLSVLIGVALGVALGLSRFWGETLEPILVSFYSLPKVTLYPVVLLLCGLGPSAKITFGVMHGLVPVVMLVRSAIVQLRPVIWRSVRVMRLTRLQILRHMLLPAIAIDLLAACRVGLSLSLLGVLIGEMFASRAGLGFAAMTAMGLGDLPTILAIGLFLSVIAITLNVALLVLETHLRHRQGAGR